MSRVTVLIPMPLRRYTADADQIEIEASNAGEAINALVGCHAALAGRLVDANGNLRTFVNVFVGGDNVNDLNGFETALKDGDVLSIIPAVAGGANQRARDKRLSELKSSIPELAPREAKRLMDGGAVLVDVREQDEIAQGSPVGAKRLGRGYLELRIEDQVPDLDRTVLLMCNGGTRSLFAAEDLRRMGYRDVRSVAGGFSRWKTENFPFEIPRLLDAAARERYSRHLLMPEVGESGQIRLLDAKVLIIGAGGLGSPAALYLAAAGVGTLGLVDHDVVDRSNLQRQILHTDDRVGASKVESGADALRALNPDIAVRKHEARLDSSNVEGIFSGYDIIVDGSDNFATRYLVNDACVKLGLPNVHGSIFRFEGQVAVFWPGYPKRKGPCYRCIYPEPPPAELAPSCAEAGVFGVLPGVIGVLEAVEVIKLILDAGNPLIGRMLYYDALQASFVELKLSRNPNCAYCGDNAQFPGYVDYDEFCNA
ncbi:MAG: molybdopterin-synthase adenylyltransferase MoeB [Gammaproteobacteria bacterium]|nr:molybdopterin-synthase adenylyltransferase MoeB [Gammaproteobacteria bacterium]